MPTYYHRATVRVLRNFPVDVAYSFEGHHLGDWEIEAIGKRVCKKRPLWLEAKIRADDYQTFVSDLWDAIDHDYWR